MRVLSVLAVLLVCCSAQPPMSLSQVSILSVTGCTDTYPTTVNCTSPANVTVWTSSALSQLAPTRLFFSTPTATSIVDCYPNAADSSNSSVVATVSAVTYDSTWIDSLINVSLFSSTAGMTASFAGFSFAYEPPPVITSISGCSGSGTATLNCAPDTSVLTLQGAGLRWVARSYWWQIVIGSKGIRPSATIVNDSYILQPLTDVYYGIVLPEYYNSGALPIYFKNIYSGKRLGVQESNRLSISFIPLPPPSVAAVAVTSCAQSSGAGNATSWANCMAGTSAVTLSGYYLYSDQVTVGGQSCVFSSATVSSITCYVALTSAFVPGVAYEVTLWNDDGRVTLPASLSFSSAPSLSYVVSCYPSLQYTYYPSVYSQSAMLCPPTYTITLRGANFLQDPAVQVTLTTLPSVYTSNTPFNMSCLNAVVLNSSTLTCVLPSISNATLAAQVYRQSMSVQVAFPTSNQLTNSLVKSVYAPPSLPIVSSIRSADCSTSTSPIQLAGCPPGATVTVTGVYLSTALTWANGFVSLSPDDNSQYQAAVTPINDTSVLVVLPLNYTWQDIELQDGLSYTMYLTMAVNSTRQQSTAFYVSFNLAAAASSASSSLSSGAIAGIVAASVVLAALLLTVAVWCCRGRIVSSPKDEDSFTFSIRPNQAGPASDSSSDSVSMTGVEMQ